MSETDMSDLKYLQCCYADSRSKVQTKNTSASLKPDISPRKKVITFMHAIDKKQNIGNQLSWQEIISSVIERK